MEGIETTALFEEKVPISPRDLANAKINIHTVILRKLAEKMEGKCSLHGWVQPHSTKILSRSMGYLESGRFTGDLVFHVQAEAKVLNPPSGSHLVGDVVGNNMMGMYVSHKVKMREVNRKTKNVTINDVDAIKIILPRDLHIGDEEFSKVQIGDKVKVEIKKSRFQVNDKFILSVGIFEGKVGSDYVAPVIEEQEEVVMEEQGPSKEAEELTGQFEREEEAKLKAKEEEIQRKLAEEKAAQLVVENIPLVEQTTEEPLLFNAAKINEFKELDNRFPAKFTLDGKEWPTVEHYYQAMKFPTLPEFQEEIRKAPTATAAGKLGRTKDTSKPIRNDWKEQREAILTKAIEAKFDQNPNLKEILGNTYPRPLVFADANDSFWGYGRTKAGQNKLGKILMTYREAHKI